MCNIIYNIHVDAYSVQKELYDKCTPAVGGRVQIQCEHGREVRGHTQVAGYYET